MKSLQNMASSYKPLRNDIISLNVFDAMCFLLQIEAITLTSFLRGLFLRHFFTPKICYLINFRKKKCKSTLLKTAIFYTTFFYVKIFFGSPWRKKRGPCVGSLTHLIFSMEIEWKEKTDNKSLVQGRVPGLYNVHIRLFAWPAWCPEPIFFVREMFLDK